jgi:hypothetical protein
MKFEIGDKVTVKISNDDGKVVEIINDKMVLVEVKGVRFPAYTDQLDYPYFKMFTQDKIVQLPKKQKLYIDDVRKDKSTKKYKVAEGVWLSFLPVYDKDIFDDDVVETLKIYLINQTDQGYRFSFWLRYRGETEMELKNEISPLQDFYLMDIPFEKLNDAPSFEFDFSPMPENKKLAEYFEASYKPKAKQVFQKIEEVNKKGEATFAFLLFEKYPERQAGPEKVDLATLNNKGFKVYSLKDVHKHIPPAQSVIDLHIEKLHDAPNSLSNLEKLTLQLNTFEKQLDLAQLNHLKEFTVIHGIGSGKLKDEIHELLKYKTGVKSFVNKYHPWYGYGATEIYLD